MILRSHHAFPLHLLRFHCGSGTSSTLPESTLADLLIETLREHHAKNRFNVHAFVVMPDHIHLLITPREEITLEHAMNFVKGTFSYRVKKEINYLFEVWSEGYHDVRIRSARHCAAVIEYIEMNPVQRGLVSRPEDYPYSSASGRWRMNPLPQWLKPLNKTTSFRAT